MTMQCVIAGGGPAGMMVGFLLARAGVRTVVLEKHADFLRDFRGDTVHPSTMEVLYELGIIDEFLKRPHTELRQLRGHVAGETVTIADFSHIPTHCKFVALMPQWDFLDFLAEQARSLPAFELRRQTEVVDLIRDANRIAGVVVETTSGREELRADLVIGADGRHSTVRQRAGLESDDFGAPMDVLWMRVSKRPGDPPQALGNIADGYILVLLDRGDYWQCAYVIPKGGIEEVKARGLDALRASLVSIAPFMRDRVGELKDWNDIKLLTVVVDRLRSWHRPGLLCIGDAAHAMSPIGGVGINLAIQDAVATANALAGPLKGGWCSDEDLAKVQSRRELPTRWTQAAQLVVQNRFLGPALKGKGPQQLPLVLKLLRRFPMLRRIPARLVGVGVRPEHVESPVAVSGRVKGRSRLRP
jgi:2-polyprenyl-6-methoxyphenol hydroxylase-like FAD-dependent oxidoreductase